MKTVEKVISEVWPGWQVESQIGAGAFGEVYRVARNDVAGETRAAVKVMKAHPQSLRSLCTDEEEAKAEFDRMMQRFGREIRLMQTLKGQTNLVSIDDYQIKEDKESGIWYILIRMELLTPLLMDLDLHSFDEDRLIRMGIELCRGLEVCEAEHIVHRDIKPENIFVNRLGNYKLGDFSTARILDLPRETMTEWNFVRGERFTAPEMKNGLLREASFEEACRADIYSLGMVLYWIANGQRVPFLPKKQLFSSQDREEAEQRRLAGEPLPDLPLVSAQTQEVIFKACAFDSRQRYESAEVFREALENLQHPKEKSEKRDEEGTGFEDRPKGQTKMEGGLSYSSHRPTRWIAAAVACLVVMLAVFWLGLPVRISVRYTLEDGTLLLSKEVALRPGQALNLAAEQKELPEGTVPENSGEVHLSVDWLRRAVPASVEFRCLAASEPKLPQTLQINAICYPKLYAIGLPFSFQGTVISDKALTELVIRVYTLESMSEQKIEIPEGTFCYDMSEVGDELFRNLQEGIYWLEICASDAAGRKIGFSNNCSASAKMPEHTVYEMTREYKEPELKGSLTYAGHTYEVYRLAGGGWEVANAFALGKGGHLATFSDEDEFNVVTSFCLGMGVKYMDIGFRYENGEWEWVDGSPFSFHPWSENALADEKNQMHFGSVAYTSDQQFYFGKATQFEMTHFLVEYEDILH